ncbi:MAG: sensor histidine kinase [Bacteroidia bacterium]
MNIKGIWRWVINSGVTPGQTYTFSDKLVSRNKLSFLCIVFSFIYVIYFSFNGLIIPLCGISFGISIFALSILLNKYKFYTLSSLLILFNTNYCVLFFSIYLGFASGIHLYLFTSPLIVLTLFDTKKTWLISLAMLSYIINFITISIIEKRFDFHGIELSQPTLDIFYMTNFCCSIFILLTLSLYFLYNNNTINQLLVDENRIRREAEREAKESLAQREVLLSEIHHRVKNNLAVISGLMELQSTYLKDKNTIGVIKETQNRIKSLAILHEKLYENRTLREVEVGSYIDELLDFIKVSLSDKEKKINITTQIEVINLEMAKAMPFALLINELICNSYKHAFSNVTSGEIVIEFSKDKNGYLLVYSDNGRGFEYDPSDERRSLGLTLIETFSQQLKGEFEFPKDKSGMRFVLRFT